MISVVIPIFRRAESVIKLLEHLHEQRGVTFEIILVDDCSPDDTLAQIHQRFPDQLILRNEKNSGPSTSRNKGIRQAKYDLIVGIDSDVTLPDPDFLRRVWAAHEKNPTVDCFAFRIMTADGKHDDGPRWCHPRPYATAADQCWETDYFSGTGYSVRRSVALAAGGFPEWLYMDYEEVEYAHRIMEVGGRIIHHPDLRVHHHVHPVAKRNRIEDFFRPRNQILITLTSIPFWRAWFYLPPRLVFNFFRCLRKGSLGTYLEIYPSALRLTPYCLSIRRPLSADFWRRRRAIRRSQDLFPLNT